MLFPLLFTTAAAMTCPLFTCGTLGTNECAQKRSSQWIDLSSLPCESGYFCSADRLYEEWWWYSFTAVGSIYRCLETNKYRHISMSEAAVYAEWPCGQRDEKKELIEGAHPKDCNNYHDCQLTDGSFSPCMCSVRMSSTQGICSPDINSVVFEEFWSNCDEDGFIENKNLGFYYSVLQRVYHFVQSDVSCAKDLFWEYQIKAAAFEAIDNWACAVSFSLFLALN